MAAAEARAAWQRVANRYFVQEDAKRAPKLACCQSSTSSSKQVDSGLANVADPPDHRTVSRMPYNRTRSYSNLSSDTKWWVQRQPNHGLQRALNQQFNSKTDDVETLNEDLPIKVIATMDEERMEDVYKDIESFLDVKKQCESGLGEPGILDSNKVDQDFLDVKNMTDYYELLEKEMVGSSNADSSWISGEKVPWWRVTDEEELASFVAQKSLHHVENCDLPPPQNMHSRRVPYKRAKSIDHDEIYVLSLDWEAHSEAVSSPSSVVSQRKRWSSVRGVSQNEYASSEVISTKSDIPEKGRVSDDDPCKAKLLEALCHSQTRAREAEKAAKQAYTEKEHILKLFFRQASQLFAYRQWLKLLQLENLLLQTENDSSPLSTLPDLLPWMAHKSRKRLRKGWQKAIKAKRRKRYLQENDIGKYAVAFAVGFTLVSAGLILGWTVGWMLPAF